MGDRFAVRLSRPPLRHARTAGVLDYGRPQLLAWAAAVAAGVAGVGYAGSEAGLGRDLLYLAVAWTPVAAIGLGIRWHRPAQEVVWRLLAAGLGFAAAGDTLTAVYRHALHRPPAPGPANVCYLLAFLLVIAALIGLGRAGRRDRDVGGMLDFAILVTGLSLLAWSFLVRPAELSTGVSLTGRLLGAGYALCSAVVLALLLRLLTAPGSRGDAYWLLLAAAALCLTSTVAYHALTLRHGAALSPADPGVTMADSGLLLSLGLFNAAALHPSMRQLRPDRSADEMEPPPTPWRVAVLAVATLVAPATLAVELLTGAPVAGWTAAFGGAVMSLLVLARMAVLLRQVHAQAGRLAALADTDVLTGVYNRRAWQRHLDRELARAARQGTPLALAVLDLDRFKTYNDVNGHPAGDHMLTLSACAWRDRLRTGDVLARLGGEEFAVLLPDCTLPAALVVAEELRRATPTGQTVSIGVTSCAGADAAAVVARADAALYEAKRRGRDRVAAA